MQVKYMHASTFIALQKYSIYILHVYTTTRSVVIALQSVFLGRQVLIDVKLCLANYQLQFPLANTF